MNKRNISTFCEIIYEKNILVLLIICKEVENNGVNTKYVRSRFLECSTQGYTASVLTFGNGKPPNFVCFQFSNIRSPP